MAKLKAASEANIHKQVADYLRMQFPTTIFRSDFAAGIRLSIGMAQKHARLQSSRAYPDLFVAKMKIMEGGQGYGGLFLELKKPGTKLKRTADAKAPLKGENKVRLKGDWFDAHLEEQAEMLERLRGEGYYATFAVGFDEAKKIIDWYLKK